MLAKRIIPCLDIKDGRVVKGINFKNLVDAGDPVLQAMEYESLGADEIVFLDISASIEKRKTMIETVKKVSQNVFIPLTVGGGINNIEDMDALLKSGADKISINTSAVLNKELITLGAKKYGSQCIVVAIDAKYNGDYYEVYTHGGRNKTGLNALAWAKEVEELGCGEILLTSIDMDGKKEGYDLNLNKLIASNVNIPVIASGGAGKEEDFYDAFSRANVDACLAASLFHYKLINIKELKEYLKEKGIGVRL